MTRACARRKEEEMVGSAGVNGRGVRRARLGVVGCGVCLILFLSGALAAGTHAMPLRPGLVPGAGGGDGTVERTLEPTEGLDAETGSIFPSESELGARGLNILPKECRLSFSGLPLSGRMSLRALVILVEFPDLRASSQLHSPRYYMSKLFETTAWDKRTLNNFYIQNSYGKLEVTGEVYGWYMLPNPNYYYSSYRAGVCGSCYPENARRMAEDAIELARPYVDFSRFDNDGPDGVPSSGDDDGYVDALFIVHSGPTYEETGNMKYIMSHQWTTPEPVRVDGVYAYVYTTEGEASPLGTFCHEMGHVLGLQDLYDTDYSSYGLDVWSLMAAGGWLDQGDTPANLDAYSKVKLGFVEPVVPGHNLESLTLLESGQHPEVYKLWKNGRPDAEYYLVENRRKVGFDSYLPGEGLLIYHVDETVLSNDRSTRYMVALEQADGLFELEGPIVEGGGGDAGDPFPGWSFNRDFSIFTGPSSRSNDGVDVEVSVTGISNPGDVVSFDAGVETRANLVLKRSLIDDRDTGDADGNPDPGESVTLYCEYENLGLESGTLSATASCANIYILNTEGTVSYDYVQADETRFPETGFTFDVDGSLSQDPFRAYFLITLSDGIFLIQKDTLVVGIGDSLGLKENFELGEGDWLHGTYTEADDWHLTVSRSFRENTSWRCGIPASETYSQNQDSFLKSPFFLSGARSRLSFYQWLDVENATPKTAWDGCLVEVSRDNVNWEIVEPDGGYPYVFDLRVRGQKAGKPCFSGRARQWERVEIDLSQYRGALWVRFRMVTDSEISGEGWYIDDVEIVTSEEPYSIAFKGATAFSDRVELSWYLDPQMSVYSGQGMGLFRADLASIVEGNYVFYELIYTDTSSAAGEHEFVDTNVEPGSSYSYALRDVNYWGEEQWIPGPREYVPHSIRTPGLASCTPNPYNPALGQMALTLDVPDVAGRSVARSARVLVYDVTGRVIKILLEGDVLSGHNIISWDGTASHGGELPSGIYVISFEVGNKRSSQKVILLR